jgi:hypothetical protein
LRSRALFLDRGRDSSCDFVHFADGAADAFDGVNRFGRYPLNIGNLSVRPFYSSSGGGNWIAVTGVKIALATHQSFPPVIVPGGLPMLVSVLITFLVVILVLYLINMLPLDGRAKQICRVIVIVLGVISLLKYIAVF